MPESIKTTGINNNNNVLPVQENDIQMKTPSKTKMKASRNSSVGSQTDKDIPTLLKETADTAPSNLSGTITPGVTTREKVMDLIDQSHLRTAWFCGNVLTSFASVMYFLTFFKHGGNVLSNTLWYKLVFVGAIMSFGVVIHQTKVLPWGHEHSSSSSPSSSKINVMNVLGNDNVHYLYCAMLWLMIPFKVTTLAIIPFFAFSVFHVVNFTGNEILPLFESQKLVQFGGKLKQLCLSYHELPREASASSEILTLFYLLANAIFWSRYSWLMLGLYSVFIKLKSESSVFTKTELKSWEVRVDGIVSSQNVPPMMKQYWGQLKVAIKSLNKWKIINTAANEAEKDKGK